ncbi:ABC transporter ATP-binding protein [Salinarchaeum laminariae]|uniref:ABC transporter ATP-binding protein n=1 Tax=Salinarchaeum laminariae TaxID=869888 RepID=UPI0020BEED84|nr:ABC transporter ATP-binding protein [Salinarchaeum laminariae]
MTLLEVDHLTKHFGGLVAVDDLSFSVDEGEIVGLIGPNGSGKTTVFNCIMSTYIASEGEIRFDGEDVTSEKTHGVVNHGLSRVSQESNPINLLSVGGNIKLFMLPNSFLACALPDAVLARRSDGGPGVVDHAERVGLEDKIEETPDSLPHADVRRLEIAKALATDPDMLLLDEPFAGMNQAEIRTLSEQIEQFREDGISMVVVDHNMRGLMQLVDRVVVISSGQKLAEGPPEEIVENQDVQDAYLAGEHGGI